MGTFIKAVFKGKCLITFDDGDPFNADTTKEVPRGTTWGKIKDSVTAPSKAGYTFQHWSTTQGGEAIPLLQRQDILSSAGRLHKYFFLNTRKFTII